MVTEAAVCLNITQPRIAPKFGFHLPLNSSAILGLHRNEIDQQLREKNHSLERSLQHTLVGAYSRIAVVDHFTRIGLAPLWVMPPSRVATGYHT